MHYDCKSRVRSKFLTLSQLLSRRAFEEKKLACVAQQKFLQSFPV